VELFEGDRSSACSVTAQTESPARQVAALCLLKRLVLLLKVLQYFGSTYIIHAAIS